MALLRLAARKQRRTGQNDANHTPDFVKSEVQ
jgi:hypothetical protein